MKLVHSASITKGLDKALPYHCTEKPVNWLAWVPALKLKIAMIAIGRYRKQKTAAAYKRMAFPYNIATSSRWPPKRRINHM